LDFYLITFYIAYTNNLWRELSEIRILLSGTSLNATIQNVTQYSWWIRTNHPGS